MCYYNINDRKWLTLVEESCLYDLSIRLSKSGDSGGGARYAAPQPRVVET